MPEAPQIALEGGPLLNIHLRALTEGIAGNGVVSTTDLEVTAGSGDLDIDVSAGDAQLLGTQYSYAGGTSVATLSAGDATYDRWDTVAFDTGTTSVVVHEGTPAQYPTAPDIQAGEIALAAIYVASGATAIDGGDITNIRTGFSNEAEQVHYNDSTGVYSVSDVEDALDELQEAAQADGYPFQNSDLLNDTVTVANNSVGLGGSTSVDLADLANALHGSLDDAPIAAHHDPPFPESNTQSGDGSTTVFTLPHSWMKTPDAATVQATSADSAGEFYVSNKTSSDIEITYTSAPPSGTDNLSWDYILAVSPA